MIRHAGRRLLAPIVIATGRLAVHGAPRAAASPKMAACDVEDLAQYHRYTAAECERVRSQLLDWYDKEQRDLPWRQGSVSGGGSLQVAACLGFGERRADVASSPCLAIARRDVPARRCRKPQTLGSRE